MNDTLKYVSFKRVMEVLNLFRDSCHKLDYIFEKKNAHAY